MTDPITTDPLHTALNQIKGIEEQIRVLKNQKDLIVREYLQSYKQTLKTYK